MKKVLIIIGVLGFLVIAYWLISPLWRQSTLNEAPPEAALPLSVASDVILDSNTPATIETPLSGIFQSDAHEVRGTAKIISDQTGTILRFEDFYTLNGPDLRIYLATDTTAQDFIDLGAPKATSGNINYTIPENTDLTKYDTVLIWCRAFSVLFGHATLVKE